MSISYKTPASFSGFSCLGGECEDTCCRNWQVKLDLQHFTVLKKSMFNDEHEKSIFEKHIHLNTNSISSDHDYAFVNMREDGFCTMLSDKGLCSIQEKYGVTSLGDVCTMFPRMISRCGDTIELSGSLSCPEVVRSCIDEKKPLKLNRFKTSDLPRSKNYPIQRELYNLDDDFYSENFNLVRNNIMTVMANEEQDFETRLYMMANIAYKLSTFYHTGCAKPDKGQIESILLSLSENEFSSKIDRFIKDYDSDTPISMIVVHSVLSIKLQQANDENISQLYKKILNEYSCNEDNVAEELAKQLIKVRLKLDEDSQQYIDKALTRYIINCLYREWFISMPDPFTYIQMLLVRISILRTLIYLDIGQKNELNQEQLKQKIVYIMYSFARNVDQNLEFLKVVYNALSEQTMMNFDFSPAFIRLY